VRDESGEPRRRHPSRSCWPADDDRTPAVVCRRM